MTTIEQVSDYYLNVSSKYLAVNVTLTGVLRKEALNEVRNAFAHVARAASMDRSNAVKEYEKALGHLQRLALDSAKDTIFELRKRCEKAVGQVEVANFILPGKVHSTLVELSQKRTELTEVEVAEPPSVSLVERYGDLMGEYYEFYKNLDAEFNIDRVSKRNTRRRWITWLGILFSFFMGILASYVANHLPTFGTSDSNDLQQLDNAPD